MRIAILGTRGIPNRYGGFERFAEVISALFAEQGHSVYVLSPESASTYNGVSVVRIGVPKWLPANAQTLLYDLKSLIWASRNSVDVVLECGYSFAFWLLFFPKSFRCRVITNPDGLEFNRSKWNFTAKVFLKLCEYSAIKLSSKIVCDNPELVHYYLAKFNVKPEVIPYGAFPLQAVPRKSILSNYDISGDYFLMVTRLTPENNIGLILDCFSKTEHQVLIVGNFNNEYGQYYKNKYGDCSNIKFVGAIYNQDELNALRYYAKAYVHGHSVGGTNPSLLEAMACGCFVIAHGNPFNRFVMGNRGLFFVSESDFACQLNCFNALASDTISEVKEFYHVRIITDFSWGSSAHRYLELFAGITAMR